MDFQKIITFLTELGLKYIPKLILALVVLVVGLWIIKKVVKGVGKLLEKRGQDKSLDSFLKSVCDILLKVMLGITVMTMLGIEMTSFVAILGAAGLAVGMALSGTLQNFAGGVMILLFRPFKVGDYIDAMGQKGTVYEIQIFHTILKTLDNNTVILANAALSNGTIVNQSVEEMKKIEYNFVTSYDHSIDKVRQIFNRIFASDKRIQSNPASLVAIQEITATGNKILVRLWVKNSEYWDVFFELNEKIKKEFDNEKISLF